MPQRTICETVTGQIETWIEKTEERCTATTSRVCGWLPPPFSNLCKWVTETLCTLVTTILRVVQTVVETVCRAVSAPPDGGLANNDFTDVNFERRGSGEPFLWGVATSSMQVEGGHAMNDWYAFSTSPAYAAQLAVLGWLGG